jgi:ATP-dependent 26S proteasome regulatory subunit
MNGEMAINSVLYGKLKSDDGGILNIIFLTFAMSIINYIVRQASYYLEDVDFKKLMNFDFFLHKLHKKNSVEYEGKISCAVNMYSSELRQTSVFGKRFKALWEYIIAEIDKNPSVHSIKEQTLNKKEDEIYMVNQKDKFLVCKELEIYAYTYTENESTNKEEEENKTRNKTSNIIIELYSYKSSTEAIKMFVENITLNHMKKLENARKNKHYIYTLSKIKYDDDISERWSETRFESTRTFNNLFFENKQKILDKIDFFTQNKEWYYHKGIPYSLGIGMHGPPGTGKTSFIKALANYTGRHIVIISLKLLKSKHDLDEIFFEDRYNGSNERGTVGFDKKIIVFEDIDCVGDIVLSREHKKEKDAEKPVVISVDPVTKVSEVPKIKIEDPITLDDILNLWDGIRETPGRILILSSNHYEKLDPALKRPGRIDITLELANASRNVIGEIYRHLTGESIDPAVLQQIPDRKYSPAEIMNYYMAGEKNAETFIEKLIGIL